MFGKFTKFTAYYSIKKVIKPNRQISNFHDILTPETEDAYFSKQY